MAAVSSRHRVARQASVRRARKPIPVQAAALSDRGQVREINEDAVLMESAASLEARTRGMLCVLADGMGGYAAGEVASQLAVQRVRNSYYASPSAYMVDALRGAVEAANQEVWQAGQRQPEHSGMGSTLTAAVIRHENLVVAHVGDSRAYLVRGGGIAQITEDHSWVAEQVAFGALTAEEAHHHPQRNVILRALGARESVDVAVYQESVRPGDALVLCSDGLSTVVSDEEIGQTVHDFPPDEAVRRLVMLANTRGAPDNVTVAIVRIPSPAAPWSARLRHWGPLIAALAVFAALGIAIGVASNHAVINEADLTQTTTEPVATATPVGETSTPAGPSVDGLEATVEAGANFRANPDSQARSKIRFDHAQPVIVRSLSSGDVPTGHTSPVWYEVAIRPDQTAFVYADYLTFESTDSASSAAKNDQPTLSGGSAR